MTSRRPPFTISDKEALANLVVYSINHRAAVTHWCLKTFPSANKSGDRMSLALESFSTFMMAVEDLEMLCVALLRKQREPQTSLVSQYAGVFIREHPSRRSRGKQEASARSLLEELRRISVKRLQMRFGIPTFEAFYAALNRDLGRSRRELRKEYYAEMRGVVGMIRQALRNRAVHRLVQAFNKTKHGFLVFHQADSDRALVVYDCKNSGCDSSLVEAMSVKATIDSVRKFHQNTMAIAKIMRALLQLYSVRLR
jgi:hypothetical protein